jgi:hypothetical protein
LRTCFQWRPQGKRNKICPRLLSGLGHDRGTDRNRRASGYPQEDQRDRQTLWAGPRYQSGCLFSYRCGPLNKRKERTHGSGRMSTHLLFPGSDSDISSSSTSLTAAGIDKRRYNLQQAPGIPVSGQVVQYIAKMQSVSAASARGLSRLLIHLLRRLSCSRTLTYSMPCEPTWQS